MKIFTLQSNGNIYFIFFRLTELFFFLNNKVVNCSFDQNLGDTYEHVLGIVDRLSHLGFPEYKLTYVCVYEQDQFHY